MSKYIDAEKLIAEIERLKGKYPSWQLKLAIDDLNEFITSIQQEQPELEKESYKNGFETARRVVARVFMQYLDDNRPDGKMCLSNGECEDIEKAFFIGDWKKIFRYAEKYQPHWKPSKEQIDALNSLILIGSFTYVGQVQDLISLKDELKKLM